jgi:thiol-disulfide isomerase/thioredoxin
LCAGKGSLIDALPDAALLPDAKPAVVAKKPVAKRPVVAIWRFTSRACGPCRAMQPVIDRLRKQGRTIYDVDIDLFPDMWKRSGGLRLPFWIRGVNGVKAGEMYGAMSERQLTDFIEGKIK